MNSKRRTWNQLNVEIEACQRCERLVQHCQRIAKEKRKSYRDDDYWGKPVGNFGSAKSDVLVVGLAPGAHGANRTGRMFTGDRSGEWLYRALHKAGLANRPNSETRTDRLRLKNCSITNICHCAPPDNKPSTDELKACRPYLDETIQLCRPKIFLALGGLAWKAVLKIAVEDGWLDNPRPLPKFGHGERVSLKVAYGKSTRAKMQVGNAWLVGSYHPSQQNTFTGRLTEKMFDQIFKDINRLLKAEKPS